MNYWRPVHPFRSALFFIGTCLAWGTGQAATIEIKKDPPIIRRRIYDPGHRPDDAPIFNPSEAGVCFSNFIIRCATEAESSGLPSAPRVTKVSIVLGLEITIWLLPGSTAKTKRHEEGHREISEDYYRNAEIIARAIAADVTAAPLRVNFPLSSPVLEASLHLLDDLITRQYLDLVSQRAIYAQGNFDRFTAHGTNTLPEAEGIARAIAEEHRRASHGNSPVPTLP